MSEHFSNKTLEEQRKAREEYLALKKMQSGELKPEPKPSEIAIVPKTGKEKIQHFWLYEKWVVLGITAAVVLITVFVVQAVKRPKYDTAVVVFCHQNWIDSANDSLEKALLPYCDDYNGDGEIHIRIINCSYDPKGNNLQYQSAQSSRLQATLAAEPSALLYLTDADALTFLQGLSTNDFFEQEPIPFPESLQNAVEEASGFSLPDGLQIACRSVSNTAVAKDKDIGEYHDRATAILKRLQTAGESAPSPSENEK